MKQLLRLSLTHWPPRSAGRLQTGNLHSATSAASDSAANTASSAAAKDASALGTPEQQANNRDG